jgi:5-methylcytosine-specific restriction protein A
MKYSKSMISTIDSIERPAYLFAWNSKPEEFDNYAGYLKKIQKKGTCKVSWRCNSTKIRPGDRVFLMKLGKYPKGIIGSGKALSFPYDGGIDIQLNVLLNADESMLDISHLQKGRLAQQNWTPQMNGTSIRRELVQLLEEKWANYLQKPGISNQLLDPIITQETYLEGAATQVTQTRYERNLQARIACLQHYGFSCTVCDFNFEKQYGPLGKSFIHVHHVVPIALIGKKYQIDPVKDLRPVCPNCHAMLHKQEPQLSIEKLKKLLAK